MGSDQGDHSKGHSNCSHDHGHDHDHEHEHEHGLGDDHGHHAGEEFVPASSVHDQFLILCAGICGLGLCYLMYFWTAGLPLAAVTEHGAESAHQQMLDEAGLGKESEHGVDAVKTEPAHTETTAPAATDAESGVHGGGGAGASEPTAETKPTTAPSTESAASPSADGVHGNGPPGEAAH